MVMLASQRAHDSKRSSAVDSPAAEMSAAEMSSPMQFLTPPCCYSAAVGGDGQRRLPHNRAAW